MRRYQFTQARRFALSLVAILGVFTSMNAGAAPDDRGSRLVGERPGTGGPPVEVTVRFGLLDIDAIDDKAQRFNIDAYFEILWTDPRLALDPGDASVSGARSFALNQIWTPGLTIVNDRGLSLMLPEIASVDDGGNVEIRQRLSGPLAVDLDLHDFPFDTQQLDINIVSYRYAPSELAFSHDTKFVGNPGSFSADNWRFILEEPAFSRFQLSQDGEGRSMLTYSITAERNAKFHVLTLAVPMMLILFMAWAAHWLRPDIIPARISMSTATVFSLIALGVSVRLSLPQIDYLTRADLFVMHSTLLVMVSLGVTVVATRWVNQDRQDAAVRLTRITRWVFPVVFALIALFAISH
jgi:hypothetical protein